MSESVRCAAIERAMLILKAKNHWMDRAVSAEARVAELESALVAITKHVDEDGWSNEAATIARIALKGNE